MRGKFTDRLIQVIFYTGILSTEISSSLEMLLPYQFSKGRERKREREKEREREREREGCTLSVEMVGGRFHGASFSST